MHGRFRYIHPQGIDHFCSLKTNRWLLDSLLGHLKKKFFCLNFRPVVGFPVKQPITSAESPVFTITKANTKSKYGKNRQKGYDGDDVDADTDEDVTFDADDDADDDVKEECVLLNFRHSDKLTLVSCL